MARPKMQRRVCAPPDKTFFGPLKKLRTAPGAAYTQFSLDEYETIRLIDYEGLTQQQCAKQMGVARTTVQGIYATARKKLSELLIEGRQLAIDGGEVKFCNGKGKHCRKHSCQNSNAAHKGDLL